MSGLGLPYVAVGRPGNRRAPGDTPDRLFRDYFEVLVLVKGSVELPQTIRPDSAPETIGQIKIVSHVEPGTPELERSHGADCAERFELTHRVREM